MSLPSSAAPPPSSEPSSEQTLLEQRLKQTLEQCISLARKKIRSKKGITQLQALLTDYRSNSELAGIILEVVKLISVYEIAKKEEADQIKDTVPLEEYNALQTVLQKYEASIRQHIKNQQQLKIYCQDLQEKNRDLEKSNEELLKNTKDIITKLKRQNQRLLQQAAKLREKAKNAQRDAPIPRDTQESIINSIKKARKFIDSQASSHRDKDKDRDRDQLAVPLPLAPSERSEESMRGRRHSLSSIKHTK